MSINKADAYLRQAQADRNAASALGAQDMAASSSGKAIFMSHAIAMCQQSVEKSVKGLYLLFGYEPRRSHTVEKIVMSLLKAPAGSTRRNPGYGRIATLFSTDFRASIRALCDLAPKGKERDPDQIGRNTEYPFVRGNVWRAPSDIGVFREEELDKYMRIALRTVHEVERIRVALKRMEHLSEVKK